MKNLKFFFFAFVLFALLLGPGEPWAQSGVSAPVLMWQYGGCLTGPYCQRGWYSSPAVADLDGDGQPEVIWGAGDVVALNGANGILKWRAASSNRIWPGIVVADLTGEGTPKVIVGRNSDQLTVYNRFGNVMWTRNPFGGIGELRTLAVADVDNNGQLEIVVGQAAGVDSRQVNVLAADGTVRSGWPARHSGEPGYGGGLWNADMAVADMNGDGFKEVFAANGSHYINAFDRNGNQLPVNGIFAPREFWSEVGVAVDNAAELRGWVNCGVEHRPDFSLSAPAIADVNGDGVPELIVVGNVRNCGTTPYTDLYHMPFIFKLDRTRWSGSGFDWTVIPTPSSGSGPRSTDSVIENAMPNAVAADLDGDGRKEILFPSYDGKVHAYWLDKTEHGNWPYRIPTSGASGDDFRFASEPIVADLNNDGRAEVIFTSWPKKASGQVGQLHILDYQGAELHRINLPAPAIGATWNGALGAPAIANIDSDSDLELVVGTVASGVVAYKLPNTVNARVLWGTGRGNYGRTGEPVATVAPPVNPPTIASFTPTSGAVGTAVTISGTTFTGATAVRLNGTSASFTVSSATAIQATVPIGATTGPISVTTFGGTATSASSFTVTASDTTPPTVTITSPVNGATVSGAVTVTADAADNVGVVGVMFFVDDVVVDTEVKVAPYTGTWNTTAASNGPHRLEAVARDAADNRASAAVIVTVANGTSPPTITSFTPTSGLVGASVTISGTNFTGATAVRFNGVSATFTVSSATAMQATVPAGATTGSISVTTPGGTATSASTFTVSASAPTITSFTPTSGLVGASVTISGTNFTGATAVRFNGVSAIFTVSSATAMQATVPAGATTGPISVTTPGGTATSASSFTVTASAPVSTATRFEETDLSIVYRPGSSTTQPPAWFHGGRSRAWSNATASFNRSAGARATLRFTGTSVTWIGFRAFWAGIARAWVDAETPTEIDLFLPPCTPEPGIPRCGDQQVQAPAFTRTDLPAGPHTLTIEATGRKHGGDGCEGSPPRPGPDCASDYPVVVDAFDVGPSSSPQTTGTRFEETAPFTTYTTGWTQGDTTRAWSNRTAGQSGTPGARATFTFTGTSVSWLGLRGPATGIARVYLDGAFHAEVDTYSPTEIQAVVLTVTDLAAAGHTLEIEATGEKNASATGAAIWVDGFDVRSRFEDLDPSMTYTAIDPASTWILENRDRAWSGTTANSGGGSAAFSAAGTRAELAFTGTAVSWIGFRGPFAGMADVSLDGAFVERLDLYAPIEELQAPVFTATGLPAIPHTLRIDVLGARSAASTNTLVVMDAFNVTLPSPGPPVTRFQERDPSVTYAPTGAWTQSSLNGFYTGGTVFSSATAGARAEFTFTGTSVRWIGQRGRDLGIARVYLDGALVGEIDTFVSAGSQERFQAPVFTATGLAAGQHLLTIEVTGMMNAFSDGTLIVVDAFDVY